jgi:hypothetical protein
MSRYNCGSSREIHTCGHCTSGNHEPQHSTRHELLEQEPPDEKLSGVMSANTRGNERLILRIVGYKFRIEPVFLDDRLNLALELFPLFRREVRRLGLTELFDVRVALLSSRTKQNSRQERITLKLTKNDICWKF